MHSNDPRNVSIVETKDTYLNHGVIKWDPILGGMKQCKSMAILGGFPLMVNCFPSPVGSQELQGHRDRRYSTCNGRRFNMKCDNMCI